MPRRKKKPERTYAFDSCKLVITRHGNGHRFELLPHRGRLRDIPLVEREQAADALKGWIGSDHEGAYRRLWDGVGKGWEE